MTIIETDHYIIITEARAAGAGIDGGKRIVGAAAANFEAAAESLGRDIERRHVGRGVVAKVTPEFYASVLAGQADERVLRKMMEIME